MDWRLDQADLSASLGVALHQIEDMAYIFDHHELRRGIQRRVRKAKAASPGPTHCRGPNRTVPRPSLCSVNPMSNRCSSLSAVKVSNGQSRTINSAVSEGVAHAATDPGVQQGPSEDEVESDVDEP